MSVIETAKAAYDLAKKGMTVELQEKTMQLREEALELQRENQGLKQENQELKEQLEWKNRLHRRKGLYWLDGDDTPYCPYCWEKNRLAIHLTVYPPDRIGTKTTDCECQECMIRYTAGHDEDFVVTKMRQR